MINNGSRAFCERSRHLGQEAPISQFLQYSDFVSRMKGLEDCDHGLQISSDRANFK